jgi:hypothetical protein
MITVLLNIQFFWDAMLCRWVCSSPDISKDHRMHTSGSSSPKTQFPQLDKMYCTDIGRCWQKDSTGGKPTEETLLCARHGLGVLDRLCLWLDCMVIQRDGSCIIKNIRIVYQWLGRKGVCSW